MRGKALRASVRGTVAAVLLACCFAAPTPVAAQDPPTGLVEPTGRAVCNIASTTAAILSYANFAVPPESPITPNDVVVALTPILRVCVDTFPPAPTRQCITAELIPDAGLPLTPPDPLGILTEQIEALVDGLLDPLGLALGGPLRDFFVDALSCKYLQAPGGDEDYELVPPEEAAPATTTTTVPEVETAPVTTTSQPVTIAHATPDGHDEEVAAPVAKPPADAPLVSLVSSLPGPLRGPAVAAALALVLALGFVLRRQLAPSRPTSLLDSSQRGR